MTVWRRLVLVLWSAAMGLVVALPWFGSGYLTGGATLAVPDLDVGRRDLWGLGPSPITDLPADAVTALLQTVVDAELLQRLVLVASVVALGIGAGRLARSTTASLALATVAVLNPFMVDAIDDRAYPLIAALAGLAWVVVGQREGRTSVVILGLAATSLVPVLAPVALVLLAVTARSILGPALLVAVVNAPAIALLALRTDWDRPLRVLQRQDLQDRHGRDLATAVVLVVVVGVAAALLALAARASRTWVVPVVAAVLAVLALISLPSVLGAADRLRPLEYDRSWRVAAEAVERSDARGDLLVRPLSVGREPEQLSFDRPTRTYASRLDSSWLARQGVGLVLVRTRGADGAGGVDAVDGDDVRRDVRLLREGGAREVRLGTGGFRLFEVPGARAPRVETLDRVVMIAAWVVVGLAVVPALISALRGLLESAVKPLRDRRSRSGPGHGSPR